MIEITILDIITRVAVAVGLGMIVGLERTLAGKTAGMRTYAMITLGSAVFVIISEMLIFSLGNPLIVSSPYKYTPRHTASYISFTAGPE